MTFSAPRVYLDYNATAPLWPEARQAVAAALEATGNPSSVHASGRAAKAQLEAARATIAAAVGASPRQLIFTSGGTEANALACQLADFMPVLVSAAEHVSLLAQAPPHARHIPLTRAGCVDLDALEAMLAAEPAFVSVMAANNETGVLNPLERIAAVVRRYGGALHTDASQALGKIDLAACPADYMSLSAHKIGGPPGVGALVLKETRPPVPVLRGGGQEWGWRAGTENLPGILGFAAALTAITTHPWRPAVRALKDQLCAAIAAHDPRALLLDPSTPCLETTAVLWMPGVPAVTQLMAFDLAGFAVSAGAACSSGKVKTSHVLAAMGYDEAIAGQTLRISWGWHTNAEEITAFVEAWRALHTRLSRA